MLGVGTLGVAALVVLYLLASLLPAIGTPSREAYGMSLADEVESALVFCDERAAPAYACDVSIAGDQSATMRYLFAVDGRCWRARAEDPVEPLPTTAEGCVSLTQQLRAVIF